MADASSLINYILIQLYSYLGTKQTFRRIDKRRSHRLKKQNREATEAENFLSLIFSFLIAGVIFIIASQYVPLLETVGPSVWLVYIGLFGLGYLIAKKWGLLGNPYA